MTKRYTGGVVSSSLPTVNSAGASGVFLLSQQADYQSRNSWPPFKVEESLRFRRSVSGHLNRTPAIASDRRTWTWSGWVKLGLLGVARQIFGTTAGSLQEALVFSADNQFVVFSDNASQTLLRTAQLFRDPSAWYHIVVAVDTTQATSSNRTKIYVNGVQVTAFEYTQYPSQNFQGSINNSVIHYISTYDGSTWAHDGYMSEINFVDGQALTASSFGATDKDGNWSPIAYTGTYGTNGFYLNFRDNISATTMGYDYSGNGNNWTLNGFNVSTANTSYDSMIDVPSDQSDGTANNRGNYCTLNPLLSGGTLSNANLTTVNNDTTVYGTFAVTSGKWYWEYTITSIGSSGQVHLGVSKTTNRKTDGTWGGTDVFSYLNNGNKYGDGSNVAYGASYVANDVIGVALDMDNYTLTFYKNNASQGTAFSGSQISSYELTPFFYGYVATTSAHINFGQRPFTYAPPTGFKTLNTFNLPEPTIKQPNKYFDATLITGTAATQVITNAGGFQPDFVWLKSRTNANNPTIYDAIRGVNTLLYPALSNAEAVGSAQLTAFNSNGFTLGASENANDNNGEASVGWQWNAGGSTVTNTAGSVSSQVRANPTAGFSIVTYTGNATGGATVGHGLGVAPSMVILKSRTVATNWYVYHSGLTSALYQVYLNLTNAQDDTGFTALNDKAPTSTVFELPGTGYGSNNSGATYVAYCFAPIAGYSAFGSYTGNGSSDGPFVFTGFRPRYFMIKNTSVESWELFDTSRSTFNQAVALLEADSSGAENTSNTSAIDILSNGFKQRNTRAATNGSGATYIYMAFAEMPFKYARAR